MKTVYVGKVDTGFSGYYVDWVSSFNGTKPLHVYSQKFNNINDAENFRKNLTKDLK